MRCHTLIQPEQKPQPVRSKVKISATSCSPLMGTSLPFFNNVATAMHAAQRFIRQGATWGEDRNSVLKGSRHGWRTFSHVVVDLGKIAQRSGEWSADERR